MMKSGTLHCYVIGEVKQKLGHKTVSVKEEKTNGINDVRI